MKESISAPNLHQAAESLEGSIGVLLEIDCQFGLAVEFGY